MNDFNPTTYLLPHTYRKLLIVLLALLGGVGTAWGQYCTSGATSTADSNCEEVIFNTISNNTAGACATYSDFTTQSTNVTIGNSYNISVRMGTCGGSFTKSGKVYIDWNQDQDFTDPGEEVFTCGPGSATTTYTGNVTVPPAAVLGSTRMRVVVEETGSLNNVNPCGSFTWGETEDYTVNVNPSSPDDIGLTAINAPSSGCNLSTAENVTVTITNLGTNSQSVYNASFQVGAGPVVTEAVNVTLASGASTTYTFTGTANLSVPGNYTITAWTTMTSDTVPVNDSSSISVTSVPGVSVYPYYEDFESGNGGWLAGGTNSSWALGPPAKATIQGATSGINAYVTGGLGFTTYNPNEDSRVLGPCFDFSALQNPWISLSVWWDSENNWDGSNLQASTDFGVTWVNVGNAFDPGNWYNNNGVIAQPGGSSEAWCGGAFGSPTGSGSWVTAAHRLDGLAGQQSVRLRITFGSDGSVQDDGFAFDDIRIAEGPVASLGPDTLLCGGDTLFADGGNFAQFAWTGGGQSQIDTITQAGTYIVQVTDSNGFFDFDTIVVSYSIPSVNIGPDSTICPEDTLILVADSTTSYLWHDGSVNQTFAATSGGSKFVTVTDSVGCTDSDTMILTIAIPPSLDLGNDTTVCAGSPVTLDAGGGPTGTVYGWNFGPTSQVVVISSPGEYIAAVTTPGGCAAVDTVEIFNFPAPGVQLGPDRVQCGTYTLDAGAGQASYVWSTGDQTQTISLSTGGPISVTVTNSDGCTQSDTVNITHGSEPTVNIGPDQILCNGQNITLDAGNPGSAYFWSTGASSQTLNVTSPGLYIVLVTDQAGCEGSDTVSIAGSLLNVNLGPDQSICGNGGLVLDAGNPGQTFAWSTGDNSQTVFIANPGTYTVTVTDQSGCDATDDINISALPGISGDFGHPSMADLLFPVQFSDSSSPTPVQWFWDFGDGGNSTQQNPSHTYQALGTFTVTLIVSDGTCRDTVTSTIEVSNIIAVDEELGARSFELYPNPSSGIFHLSFELDQAKGIEIEVLDLNGRRIMGEALSRRINYQGDLDLSTQPQGVYLLRIRAGEGVTYRKLIRQ